MTTSSVQHFGQVIDLYKARGDYFAEICDLVDESGHMANLGPRPPKVDVGYLVTFEPTEQGAVNVDSTSEVALPEGVQSLYAREGVLEFPPEIYAAEDEEVDGEAEEREEGYHLDDEVFVHVPYRFRASAITNESVPLLVLSELKSHGVRGGAIDVRRLSVAGVNEVVLHRQGVHAKRGSYGHIVNRVYTDVTTTYKAIMGDATKAPHVKRMLTTRLLGGSDLGTIAISFGVNQGRIVEILKDRKIKG